MATERARKAHRLKRERQARTRLAKSIRKAEEALMRQAVDNLEQIKADDQYWRKTAQFLKPHELRTIINLNAADPHGTNIWHRMYEAAVERLTEIEPGLS